ncbi:hypothetical protein AB0945_08860 [Streptomyces sp. NPDC005474]|uniref:hypothetical protein n=1 Tax=Streptomyces sp. NPDC005474 TaxID=3154878 RepID=UPI0034544432
MSMNEDGQPFGALVCLPADADADAEGAARPRQGPDPVGHCPVRRTAVHAPVGDIAAAEHAQRGAEEALRAVHDLCRGDRSPLSDREKGRG